MTDVKTEKCRNFGCPAEPSTVSSKPGALSQYAAGGGLREEAARGTNSSVGGFCDRRREEMRVGFIRLGMMGKGMAANLQKAGYQERASNGSRPLLQDKVDALRAYR